MSYWATLDLKQFGAALLEKFNSELNEGLTSLESHLPQSERTRLAFERLRKRGSSVLAQNVEILMRMYKDGVFVEPPDAYRKRPAVKDASSIDDALDKLERHRAQIKAELESIEFRQTELDRRVSKVQTELAKVGQVQTPVNMEKVENLSRKAKRLRLLVNASAELKAKLPDTLDPKDVDALLEREQRKFSLQQLTSLNERLGKIDK